MAVLQSLISPWKSKGKKGKNYYNTGYSYLVTHPSTKPAEQGLQNKDDILIPTADMTKMK